MAAIDTDKISVFAIIEREGETLCGEAVDTGRYAAIGGGMDEVDLWDMFAALFREVAQEAGMALALVLAYAKPLIFYTDAETKRYVKKPKGKQKVKLHVYFVFREVGDGAPEDASPQEIRDVAFRPTAFFAADMKRREAQVLRPSLHYALKRLRKAKKWPDVALPEEPVVPDAAYVARRLKAMDFAPRKARKLVKALGMVA